MITVLNIIDTGGPGGAETVFLATSTALDPRRFKVVCVVSHEGWLTMSLREKGIEPLVIPASGSFNLSYLTKIVRIAQEVKADIIVGHLYGSSIYGSVAATLLRRPAISVLHGQSDVAGRGRMDFLKRLLLRHCSRKVVFVSGRLMQEIQGMLGVPDSKCIVIPNGVDLTRFTPGKASGLRKELGISRDATLVGSIGNIRAPKAYDVLLHAARIVLDQRPDVRFVVAGEGSSKLRADLETLRGHLQLKDALVFLGLRSDVPEILASLDVFVLSSVTEGFSIACIEAMATAIPVVSTRSGGPEEILEHGVTGLLVPASDPSTLAAAILRIIGDKQLAKNLASAARRVAREKYSLPRMLASYEQLIEDVCANPQRIPS